MVLGSGATAVACLAGWMVFVVCQLFVIIIIIICLYYLFVCIFRANEPPAYLHYIAKLVV